MLRVSSCPALAFLALSALPALAEVRVLVDAPALAPGADGTLQLKAAVTGAPSQAVTWTTSHGAGISAEGLFTAPAVGELTFCTVRATSCADGKAFGEFTVMVLPGAGAQKVPVPTDQAPDLKGLPYLTFEDAEKPDARYPSKATVDSGSITRTAKKQVVGYDLPVALTWDAKHAAADGALVTLREGGELLRLGATGQSSTLVRLKGRVQDCRLEALSPLDRKADTWSSHVDHLDLQVRGMVPFAGNAASLDDLAEADGKGVSARFRRPQGLTLLGDPAAGTQVCVAADDETHVLRTIAPDGTVKTAWGKAGERGFMDGPPGTARFDQPRFLAAQPASADRFAFTRTFVVSDTGNHAIRVVQEDGTVSTLAGTGLPGPAQVVDNPRQAQFRNPQGVAMDFQDNVYVADAGNFVIRRIDPQGRVTTLAGSGQKGAKDGLGPAASFTDLKGMCLDKGTLFVVDGHAIRGVKVGTGEVETIIGNVDKGGFANGSCRVGNSHPCLNGPRDVVVHQNRVFITDAGNHAIRTLSFMGSPWFIQSTLRVVKLDILAGDRHSPALRWGLLRDGLPLDLPPTYATLDEPRGIIPDGVGGLYVSTGKVLAHLSESAWPETNPGFFSCYLDHPSFEHKPYTDEKWSGSPLRAGRPTKLVLWGSSRLQGDKAGKTFTWKIMTFDQDTGALIHKPLEGASTEDKGVVQHYTFTQPGNVGVLVSCLTEEGCTFHDLVFAKVEP